jgi:hypothetical protein
MAPAGSAGMLSPLRESFDEAHPMYTSFAAGTLVVLGVLITVLGFLGGGSMAWVGIGLASIFGAGLLGLFERRLSR